MNRRKRYQRNTEHKQGEQYHYASYLNLIWWKFKKHKLAVASTVILGVFYFIALFCEFIAPYAPTKESGHIYASPQKIYIYSKDDGLQRPFVYGLTRRKDRETFRWVHEEDRSEKHVVQFFLRGQKYELFGLFKMDIHLFGTKEGPFFLFGTDRFGRDLFSRIIYGTRISITIGLVGIFISFIIGLVLGGISGYFGGIIDNIIQRIIDFLISIPTLPLWMALSAAMPRTWSVVQMYFAITVIFSIIGWTSLARVVRGKLLALREEDFVLAARICGASEWSIIRKHLIPSFMSYIIVQLTLSMPAMILGETALSFLGLGLQPPAVSWGVLLQDAQRLVAVAHYAWLLLPVPFVIITVLAFNFIGDGLRDAADPYSR